MTRPRTPGAGISRARDYSLDGDSAYLSDVGSPTQRRYRLASRLDREADVALFHGRHTLAEYLAHQAEALRRAVAP